MHRLSVHNVTWRTPDARELLFTFRKNRLAVMHHLAVHNVISTISIEYGQYDCREIPLVRNALPSKLLLRSLDHVPPSVVDFRPVGPDAIISPRTRGFRLATHLMFATEDRMTEERFNALACRIDGNESLLLVIDRLKDAGIACEITTASAWWRGLPRTEHSVMTKAKDVERARTILGPICSTLPESPISRERKVFIIVALAVILLVALWRIALLIFQ